MQKSGLREVLFVVSIAATAAVAVACGCGASQERAERGSDSRTEPSRKEAWGASFVLPDGWSGGESPAGGYEYTDGEIALLVGRQPALPEQTLEQLFDDRRHVLVELGALSNVEQRERRIGGVRAIGLSARAASEGGNVAVRLLVVRLGPDAGLSLMMIADPEVGRLDRMWDQVVSSLRLP